MVENTDSAVAGLRRYGSVEEVFTDRRVRVENRAFIRSLLFRIKVAGLYRAADHVVVARADGGQAIHVYAGYSNGFASEDEILAAVGDVPRWPSKRFAGAWGVDHPINGGAREESPAIAQARSRVKAAAAEPKTPRAAPKEERAQPVCPSCFLLMALSGVCGSCG